MSAVKTFKHLFLPHDSNNHKAKILHNHSLLLIVLFVAGFQLLLNIIPKSFPQVLGYAANISPAEVIRLTNEQRTAAGLSPLTQNRNLDQAALAKGQDMLSKGYWAHFAPDGKSPWSFFLNFGYKYQYAGENLARDFSNAGAAVSAWMNSTTHKENILNPHYREIGIGVVEGPLSGVDTTIIVQFFGAPLTAAAQPIAVAKAQEADNPTPTPATETPVPTPTPSAPPEEVQETLPPVAVQVAVTPQSASDSVAASTFKPLISPFQATKNLSLFITGIILLVLSLDLLIVRRNRIFRIGGRTLAHIAYISMVLAVILILKAGRII